MKSVIAMITAHATLTQAVTDAVKQAIEAGLPKADVAAVLTRLVELLEADE